MTSTTIGKTNMVRIFCKYEYESGQTISMVAVNIYTIFYFNHFPILECLSNFQQEELSIIETLPFVHHYTRGLHIIEYI